MRHHIPILSITGSDSSGASGIQADIRTISALGGYATTAVTSVTVQDDNGILHINDMPTELIAGQVRSVVNDSRPKAVKVGMVRDAQSIRSVSQEIVGCRNKVMVPGIVSAHGDRLLSDDAITAWRRYLIPQATLLSVKCSDAEVLTGTDIHSDKDIKEAAEQLHEMGAQSVMIRGSQHIKGMLTAVLLHNGECRFFSSHNTDGWQKHGVNATMSSAIATRLAMGDNVPDAVTHAHDYIHSLMVYAVTEDSHNSRPADIYNTFISLLAANYRTAHDVSFYADKLAITPRYLAIATDKAAGKSPKTIIAEYLTEEAAKLLSTSRMTMQDISNTLGFASQTSFTRVFSQHKGCTPTEYRIVHSA